MEMFTRSERLLGADGMARLKNAGAAVFGIGGVGSYCAEALVRGGIGRLLFVDADSVDESNLNRQLVALRSTVGKNKAEVMRDRALDINPEADIVAMPCFYDETTADGIDLSGFDYIVDAIDTVSSKLLLIERAIGAGTPIISAMGAGNKLDPARFEVADISETSVCPLARVMRRELKKRGIEHLKVVYSREPAITAEMVEETEESAPRKRRTAPGSVAFVPSAAGLLMAAEVIKDIAFMRGK